MSWSFTRIWWYPERKSNLEKYGAPYNSSRSSSIIEIRYLSLMVPSLRARKLAHKRHPSYERVKSVMRRDWYLDGLIPKWVTRGPFSLSRSFGSMGSNMGEHWLGTGYLEVGYCGHGGDGVEGSLASENGWELGENSGDVWMVVGWVVWYVARGYLKEQGSHIEVLNLLVC